MLRPELFDIGTGGQNQGYREPEALSGVGFNVAPAGAEAAGAHDEQPGAL